MRASPRAGALGEGGQEAGFQAPDLWAHSVNSLRITGNNHGARWGAPKTPSWVGDQQSVGQSIESQGGRMLLGPKPQVLDACGFTVQGS